MNNIKIGLFFILNLLIFSSFAQEKRICPHVEHSHDTERNELLHQKFLELQKQKRAGRIEDKQYIIPVVVHVLHLGEEIGDTTNISEAQIQSQIDVLNEDFSRRNEDQEFTVSEFLDVAGSLNIRFELAEIAPDGSQLEEHGIDRIKVEKHEWSMLELKNDVMPETAWEQTQYFNIWTVGNIRGFLGFAQFPDSSGLAGLQQKYGSAETDGLVIDYDHFGSYAKFPAPQLSEAYPFHLGRTATHEIGHALGLFHIWGDVTNCHGNDYCEDTPEVASSSNGCFLEREGCSALAMVQNYMDYSDDGCMNIFTQDQIDRFYFVLENSPRRRELTESAKIVLSIETQIQKSVQIYPNPAQNKITVQSKNIQIQDYELINLVGQSVLSGVFSQPEIGLPLLANGIYILKLKTNKGLINKRILIQR